MGMSELDSVLAASVEHGGLACVAAAAWTSDGMYTGAFGDAAAQRAMQPDTMIWIASMTKAVTAAAVMQLVERGVVGLDQPAGDLVPYLRDVQVLDGFAPDGTPRLRAPVRPVTLRHLLTHSSGFGYEWADESLARFVPTLPAAAPGSQASFEHPLTFDPGDGWKYGIGIDWVGRVVEAASGQRLDAYLDDHLLGPLGMGDTTFHLSDQQRDRLAEMRLRGPNGFDPIPFGLPQNPEMLLGGGGLYSTVIDYLRFTRMILGGGQLDGVRVLADDTVRAMATNQLAHLPTAGWRSFNPMLTNDVDVFPGEPAGWALSFLVNHHTTTEGRSAGSLMWGGLANTYYWIDLAAGVTGVFATQVLPFFDAPARAAFAAFERAVYDGTG